MKDLVSPAAGSSWIGSLARVFRVTGVFLAIVMAIGQRSSGGTVTIEDISGLWSDGFQSYAPCGAVTLTVALDANDGVCYPGDYIMVSNGIEIFSPDGLTITNVQGSTLPAWDAMAWGYSIVGYRTKWWQSSTWSSATAPFDIDPGYHGVVGFTGVSFGSGSGMPCGFDGTVWQIQFDVSEWGYHFCLKRAPVAAWQWDWAIVGSTESYPDPYFCVLDQGCFDEGEICFEIRPVANLAPVFEECPDHLPVHYGETFEYQFQAIDPETGPVTYRLESGPGSLDPNTGLYTFTPEPGDLGQSISLRIGADDQPVLECQTAKSVVCQTVLEVDDGSVNLPPAITNCPAPLTLTYGETATFDFDATDPEGDPITFSKTGSGSIDPATGVWTLTPYPYQRGNWHTLTVCATDDRHLCVLLDDEKCQLSYYVTDGSENIPPAVTNCPTEIVCGYATNHMFDFDAYDSEGDSVTFEIVSGPGAIDPATGIWSYYPNNSLQIGQSLDLVVCAIDPAHLCEEQSATRCQTSVQISDGSENDPPEIVGCYQWYGIAEWPGPFKLGVQAGDPDVGDIVSWLVADRDGLTGSMTIVNDTFVYHPDREDVSEGVSRGVKVWAVDSHGAYDECTLSLEVYRAPYAVKFKAASVSGGHVYVPAMFEFNFDQAEFEGFDLLIGYDTTNLVIQGVQPGPLFSPAGSFQWEKIEYSSVDDCLGDCPRGLVRVHAEADTSDGHMPSSLVITDSTVLFTLDLVSDHASSYSGRRVPLQFFWMACDDNKFGISWWVDGAPAVSRRIYDYSYMSVFGQDEPLEISDGNRQFPSYWGIWWPCFYPPEPLSIVDYYSVLEPDYYFAPRAYIEEISPNPVPYGDPVSFTGQFRFWMVPGEMLACEWKSSLDGVIGNQLSFSTSDLSPGEHKIFLRVQNTEGYWSPDYTTMLSVVPEDNTPVGLGVALDLGQGVDVVFESVTDPGYTGLRVTSAGPSTGSSLAVIPFNNPVFYDVSTTATFTGVLEVCFQYEESDISGDEADVRLYHFHDNLWADVTSSLDQEANRVCGEVTSLSYFALVEPCCVGRVGDANGSGDDEPTIGDISVLIDMLFISADASVVACMAEADVNQSGGSTPTSDDITIGDISVLIDYLFITGESVGLPACL